MQIIWTEVEDGYVKLLVREYLAEVLGFKGATKATLLKEKYPPDILVEQPVKRKYTKRKKANVDKADAKRAARAKYQREWYAKHKAAK